MHLDYRLSEKWDEDSTDLSTVAETDLRYYVAPGDIILRAGETDLSANWGWIPLIDFALALREIANALAAVAEGSEVFEFTESEATLEFQRQGHEVAISGSYAPGKVMVPLPVFKEQVNELARRLDAELLAKRPELGRNPIYREFNLSGA
jgi:hypothetical protein